MNELLIIYSGFKQAYPVLKKEWDSSDNMFISINPLELEELNDLVLFLLDKIPDEFAFDLLSELAEYDTLKIDLVKEIYLRGNTACKVAVCLRGDLNNELKSLCRKSNEKIVREHFRDS